MDCCTCPPDPSSARWRQRRCTCLLGRRSARSRPVRVGAGRAQSLPQLRSLRLVIVAAGRALRGAIVPSRTSASQSPLRGVPAIGRRRTRDGGAVPVSRIDRRRTRARQTVSAGRLDNLRRRGGRPGHWSTRPPRRARGRSRSPGRTGRRRARGRQTVGALRVDNLRRRGRPCDRNISARRGERGGARAPASPAGSVVAALAAAGL